ncbi:hypothetical protein BHE74_00046815 [Ensete ventricosum]|nr:hypothetical protein BHE74_00046815 [Ensete ventricosum]RZS07950.1 hypothetical protein BHM03_00038866 [Ensete ventricosum]
MGNLAYWKICHEWILVSIDDDYLTQGFPYRAVRPCTARYVPVRQLTGMWTGRYRAVLPKGDCRWSISTVGGRWRRNREGKKKKKKEEEKRKRKGTSSCPRPLVVAALAAPMPWVEGMAPVFSRAAWQCVWHLIQVQL